MTRKTKEKESKSKICKILSKFTYTEERSLPKNILYFLIALLGMFILPSVFYIGFDGIIHNDTIRKLASEFLYILVLYLMYYKDINREFKKYKDDFKNNFSISFKYYILGFIIMIVSNYIISIVIGEISTNESSVRENLFSYPLYTMISIMLIAPLSEEMVFRKSLMPIFKNKWVYATICGLLFGGAHLLAGELTLINLIYLIPYGSLGFVFALMNKETNTTFSSITIHSIHNTFTGLLLLITYYMGVL